MDEQAVILEVPYTGTRTSKQDYPGMTGFVDPLDLAEDLSAGNLYVAEYTGKHITLKPHASAAAAVAATSAKSLFSSATDDSLASKIL